MKKKIIVALTALSVLAFPMSSLAANSSATQNTTVQCSVADCQINGTHEHNASGTHNETGHSGSHRNSGNGRHHQ